MKHKKRFFIRDFSMLILHTFLKINFVHREVLYLLRSVKTKGCSKILTFYDKTNIPQMYTDVEFTCRFAQNCLSKDGRIFKRLPY